MDITCKTFSAAIGKACSVSAGFITSLLEKHRQRYILRRNIAELRSLDDLTLKDIGMVRGDIAALATGHLTVKELNQIRSTAGKPEVRLVSSNPDANSDGDLVNGHGAALVDHAA